MNKQFIRIDTRILSTDKLKDGEKLLLSYLKSFTLNNQKFIQRNDTICKALSFDTRKLQRLMSSLKDKGLINVEFNSIYNIENKSFNGTSRIVEVNLSNLESFLFNGEVQLDSVNLTDRLKSTYESMFRTNIENDMDNIFYEEKVNAIEKYISLLDNNKLSDYAINEIEVEFESGNYSIIDDY